MRPFVEKLHLDENTSFYARTHNTPRFEVPWHQHVELELILFKKGFGTAFIGNHVGVFNAGDIYLLGSNLPHTFQKTKKDLFVSALVVQFEEHFLGTGFLEIPEARSLPELFATALKGILVKGKTRKMLYELVNELEQRQGLSRVTRLIECLNLIAETKEYETLSTQEVKEFNSKNKERIDKIYQYTIDHFSESISLGQVAALASMSIPAFCSYFKKCTKKTYIEFLNEIRIGNACKLLTETQKPVSEICFECGFNTPANFNKQFYKVKGRTPMQYRKLFLASSQVLQ